MEPSSARRKERGDDRWEWRRRIRSNPRRHHVYRVAIAVAGALLILLGLVTGPLPGPGGIPLVLAGLAVLASEFVWARHLLDRAKREVRRAGHFVAKRPRWLRWTGSAASLVALAALAWLALVVLGPPALLPEAVRTSLGQVPGVRS